MGNGTEQKPDPLDVDCPFCGAKKGEPCRSVGNNPYGPLARRKLIKPHANRVPKEA